MLYNFFKYFNWYLKFPKLFPNFYFQIINKFKNFLFMKKKFHLSKKYEIFLSKNNISNLDFLIQINQTNYENFYKTKIYKKTKKNLIKIIMKWVVLEILIYCTISQGLKV